MGTLKRRVLWLGMLLPFALLSSQSWAEEEVEEVVVTGSYIKRSTEDSPSPLSVLDKGDLDEIGATDVKDIVRSLTFNSGSLGGSSSAFYGGDNSTGQSSINLRNLGNGATLLLLNGKRTVSTSYDNVGSGYVDLQSLVPNIALQRLEIVKDGSSALYGSDAVAGVVNFITRQDFDGFEMQFDYGTDDATKKQDDALISAIMGVTGDRGNITVSASYLDRGALEIADRYDTYGQSGVSTFGQPGRYVPLGAITADPASVFVPGGSTDFGGRADPDCNLAAADDGEMGVLGTFGPDICIYDFSSLFSLVMEETQAKFHVDANFQVSDNTEVYGSLSFSDNASERNNSLYPDVNFAIIPSDHFGLQLDAARRGVNPVPYLALQRMMGGHRDSNSTDRPVDTVSTYDRAVYRMNVGSVTDFDFDGRAWTLDVSATYSQYELESVNPSDTITSNVDAAYVGLGGPDCDPINGSPGSGNLGTGSCYYYNNFATSVYDPVTGARWDTADNSVWAGAPASNPNMTVAEAARMYMNPVELYRWMQGEITNQTETEQVVFDVVFAGDLWETNYGNVGLAVGAQYRRDETEVDLDSQSNNNNYKFIYGAADWDNKLTSFSLFTEVFIPVNDWIELTLAARYEDFDELGVDTIDPKATVLMRPTDSLAIRASVGTSFRVGSLLQTGGSSTTLLNSSDAFSGSGGLAFRPSITTGNPELTPEEADVFNVGLSWNPIDGPLEGLSVDIDYYDYEYSDLISREGHQDLINQDNALRCPDGLNSDAMAGPLCGAVDTNGDGITEVYSLGAGIPDKVIRGADGSLLRTQASYFNAPTLNTSGIDLKVGYRWETDNLGLFRAELGASYTLDYELSLPDGSTIDGVGSRNAGNSVGYPLPEYKANLSLGWTRDRHSASVIVRYVDEYEDDVPQSAVRGAFIGFAPTIDSMTTVDLQYNLQLPAFSFQTEGSTLTLGIKNAFDEDPPLVNVDGAFDYFTHDPRGRIFYMRYLLSI